MLLERRPLSLLTISTVSAGADVQTRLALVRLVPDVAGKCERHISTQIPGADEHMLHSPGEIEPGNAVGRSHNGGMHDRTKGFELRQEQDQSE